jgi:hypothetical protein
MNSKKIMDEHNGLLKWQHYVCHVEKMKNVNWKKCQSSVKIKIKR